MLCIKEFLNKAWLLLGNQIREQVYIESSARPVQCMKANTEFLQVPFEVVEALGAQIAGGELKYR